MSEHEHGHEWARLYDGGTVRLICSICGISPTQASYDSMAAELAGIKDRLTALEAQNKTLQAYLQQFVDWCRTLNGNPVQMARDAERVLLDANTSKTLP